MQGIQGVKAKDIAKYALLPGIIPRINALIGTGFGWLAFTMAVIYNGVRLLPHGHPYLNPQNLGKYGIRHVIAEPANNIVVQSALIKAPAAVEPAKEPVAAPAVEAVTVPAASPASPQMPYLIPALVVTILALMGAALALRRRTIGHPTT